MSYIERYSNKGQHRYHKVFEFFIYLVQMFRVDDFLSTHNSHKILINLCTYSFKLVVTFI